MPYLGLVHARTAAYNLQLPHGKDDAQHSVLRPLLGFLSMSSFRTSLAVLFHQRNEANHRDARSQMNL
jgi:hypothetical protein